jgi:hypothetical protein
MTMYIIDEFEARKMADEGEKYQLTSEVRHLEIKDPTFIPRIGETIVWFYDPTPHVKIVIYDYHDDAVWVVVG